VPSARVLLVPAYQAWDAQGLLNVTEGDIIDYDEILETLREIRGTSSSRWSPTTLTRRP
jgi:phage terminase large subunit-like protein